MAEVKPVTSNGVGEAIAITTAMTTIPAVMIGCSKVIEPASRDDLAIAAGHLVTAWPDRQP